MIDRLLSCAEGPRGDWAAVAIAGERGAAVAEIGGERVAIGDEDARRGDGSVRIGRDSGLVAGLAAQSSQIGFDVEGGIRVGVQAIGASVEQTGGSGFEGRGVAWAFEGIPDDAAVRAAWAALADGSLLVVCAVRPQAQGEHDSDRIGSALIGRDGSLAGWEQSLLSTEYDESGEHGRATLELWADEETPANRGAGRRRAGGTSPLGGITLAAAAFDWRLDGTAGFGAYDVLAP